MKLVRERWYYGLIAGWIAWTVGLWIHGTHPDLFGGNFDFEKAGQFGDAFGSLSGLMAALAAMGAWSAVAVQRDELSAAKTQAALDSQAHDREARQSRFFQLMAMLETTTNRLVIRNDISGIVAFDDIFCRQDENLHRDVLDNIDIIEGNYLRFYQSHGCNAAPFFRFVYHVLVILSQYPEDEKTLYSKIFFSQMSNSQLMLLAANHAFHKKGRNALKFTTPERLLHNTDLNGRDHLKLFLEKRFGEGYFS